MKFSYGTGTISILVTNSLTSMYHYAGVTVVGCDIAEEAAIAFVKEHHQLTMCRTEVMLKNGEQTVVYETPDKRLKFYVCRFESMLFTGEKFDMVWDRAAFIALDPNMRQTFVDSTFELLRPDFRWLQESIEYPPGYRSIPPHSVSDAELWNLFGTHGRVELLWKEADPKWSEFPWCNRRVMLYAPPTCPVS
uniref:Putative thiopurine S-methyltransferase n=1 Tax=Schistocephalus solidus TaxID=70667 RepID=A0A0X3P7F9_SCHSO